VSNTVDNRVVEMRFDNDQFEKGVKETITSLNELKQALKFNSASVNLNTVQKAINSFSLSNIEQSLAQVADRFSTLGIVGMNVIGRLTNGVLNLGAKIASISISQIITGGKGRAQKVADARFKLDGLLKDAEKVQSAFDSASKAVDGTAYGLDAAVSIASQLAASNVQLGEDMDSALRGVAGLAAMTGSSFEDMGNIFATVAGNGRLMGMQLTQISSRGINVAAELAKQMNTTESEIRDMVSKGKISFKQFASAMEAAFGDQAAKANETLTGALDNVRAALSRIGEIFYSGIIENKDFIKFINDIRVAINGVKKALEPLREPFKAIITSASKLGSAILRLFNVDNGFSGMVDTIAGAMTKAANWIDLFAYKVNQIADVVVGPLETVTKVAEDTKETVSAVTEEIRNLAGEVWQGKYGNGEARKSALGGMYEQVQSYVNAMKEANFDLAKADEIYTNQVVEDTKKVSEAKSAERQAYEEAIQKSAEASRKRNADYTTIENIIRIISLTLSGVKKTIGAVTGAVKRAFSSNKIVKNLKTIVNSLRIFTENLEITDKRAKKLEDGFTGVLSIVDMVSSAISNFISGGLKILGPVLSVVLDIILDIFSAVGRAIEATKKWIESNKLLTSIGTHIVSIFSKVANAVKRFYEGFVNLPAVKEITSAFKTFIKDVAEKLLTWFNEAADATDKFFDNFEGQDTDPINVVLGGINTALEKFIDLAKDGKKNFSKAFDWVTRKIDELKALGSSIADIFGGIENVKEATEDISESEGPLDLITKLTDSFSNFGDKLEGFVEKIVEKIKGLDAAKIALFGLSGGITAFLISVSAFLVKSGKLVEAFTALPRAIINTLNSIGQAIRDLKKFFMLKAETKLILAIAVAIGVLVGSIYLLSKIPERQLIVAASAMAVLIIVLEVMIGLLGSLAKNSAEIEGYNRTLWSFAAIILTLGVAIAALAYSVKTLTDIDWKGLNSWLGLGVLVILLGSLVGIAVLLSNFAPVLAMGGLGIIAFAGAVYILVGALKKLTELELNYDAIKDKMDVLCKALIAVGVVAALAGHMTFGGGMGVLVVIASIYLVEKELQWLITNGVSMDDVKKHIDKIGPVLAAMGIIGAYIVALSWLVKDVPRIAGLLIATVFAIYAITLSLRMLTRAAGNDMDSFCLAIIGFIAIVSMLTLLIYTIGSMGQANRIKQAGNTLSKLGFSMLLMAGVVAILGKLNREELDQGLYAVIVMAAIFSGFILVTKYAGNINSRALLSMVAVIAALTIFVGLVSYMKDIISVLFAMGVIGISLISFGIAMQMATRYINKNTEKGIVAMLAVLTITIFGLVTISEVAEHNGVKGILAAAGAISGVLIFFGIAMAILDKAFKGVRSDTMKSRMMMVNALTVTLAMIMLGMTAVLTTGAKPKSIIAAAGAIAGVLLVLVSVIAILNLIKADAKSVDEKAAALLLASLAMIPIAVALRILAGYKWDDMKGPLLAMVVVIGIVAAALAGLVAISKSGIGLPVVLAAAGALAIVMIAAAAAMYIFAKAMLKVVKGIKQLTKIEWDKIDISVLSQLVTLLLKLVGITALAGLSLIVLGVGLLAITPGLTAIAMAVALVVGMASKFIDALTRMLKVVVTLVAISDDVSASLDEVGDAISRFIFNLIKSFGLGIKSFLAMMVANATYISTSLKIILVKIAKDALEAKLQIAELIIEALVKMLEYVAKRLPDLLKALNDILIATLKSIAENSLAYGYYGAIIAIDFCAGLLAGLAEALPDLVDAAVLVAVSIGEAIESTFEKYKGTLGKTLKGTVLKAGGYAMKGMQFQLKSMGLMWDPNTNKQWNNLEDWLIQEGNEQQQTAKEEAIEKARNNGKEIAQSAVDGQTEGYKSVDTSEAEDAAKNALGKATNTGYTSIVDDIKSMAGELKNDFGLSIGSIMSGGEEAAEESGQAATKVVMKYYGDLPYYAQQSFIKTYEAQGYKNSLNGFLYKMISPEEVAEQAKETIGKIPSEALEAMEKNGYQLNETGTQIIKGVKDGAEDEAENTDISGIFTNLMNGDEINSKFNSDGEDAFGNWLGGIDTVADDPFNKNKMTKHGIDYANLLNNGFTSKDGIDSSSPSKKSALYAGYWIDGLVLTLESTKRQNEVNKASLDVASGMMNSFNNALDTSFSMDILQPTISPVLDDSNMQRYSGVLNTLANPATMKLAADSTLSVQNSDQARMAQQIEALSKEVNALANKDFSKDFERVQFNVNANTTVDGKVLRKTSAAYTIDQIDRQERAIIMAKGGRA
jgi:tape measure domain-containing protein